MVRDRIKTNQRPKMGLQILKLKSPPMILCLLKQDCFSSRYMILVGLIKVKLSFCPMIGKENLSPPSGLKEKTDHHSCNQNKSWEPEGNQF